MSNEEQQAGLEPIERSADFERCYGCGRENERGFQLLFRRDPAARKVVARWTPPPHVAGYGRMLHGGAIATLLDEAMGWALWGLEGRFGVTQHLDVRFQRPILVGKEATIVGWIEATEPGGATIRAQVHDKRGRVTADATGAFRFIGGDKVRDSV